MPSPAEEGEPSDHSYSLDIVQQPVRARMCGFGDKVSPADWCRATTFSDASRQPSLILGAVQDRRPITPPPCVRLVVKDASTHKELDIKSVSLHPAAFDFMSNILDIHCSIELKFDLRQ